MNKFNVQSNGLTGKALESCAGSQWLATQPGFTNYHFKGDDVCLLVTSLKLNL